MTQLKIASWEESPVKEYGDGSKLTRARITLEAGEEGLGPGTSESVLFYRPDGMSSFTGLVRLEGTLDGCSGTFVLLGAGSYDGTTALEASEIVEGSGTGDLAGISGVSRSVSTHADYPYMPLELQYELPQ
jgi:Protein of unknown function (DUF3224)